MRDELVGATQPMLSILLDPGESIIGGVNRFAWMTDSIEMEIIDETGMCVYTATGEPGVIAFASHRPGSILTVEVGPDDEAYLVRTADIMARTAGVQLQPFSPDEHDLARCRIGGCGRAWVGLAGDVVRRGLTPGQSLRAHPEHIAMFDSSIAIQVTQVQGTAASDRGYPCAVLSGPGVVWLQSHPSATERLPQPSKVPPSTFRLTPLTAGLRSRNATASTTSAIWASRPQGVRATT